MGLPCLEFQSQCPPDFIPNTTDVLRQTHVLGGFLLCLRTALEESPGKEALEKNPLSNALEENATGQGVATPKRGEFGTWTPEIT